MEYVNVTLDLLKLMEFVHWELRFQFLVMLELSLIRNFKNVYHVLMDAWVVKIVTIVPNADLTTHLIQEHLSVLKIVVMEKDTHLPVTMEITSTVMDAVWIVKFK